MPGLHTEGQGHTKDTHSPWKESEIFISGGGGTGERADRLTVPSVSLPRWMGEP